MRRAASSSSAAPEYAAACSINSLMFSLTAAMRCSISARFSGTSAMDHLLEPRALTRNRSTDLGAACEPGAHRLNGITALARQFSVRGDLPPALADATAASD